MDVLERRSYKLGRAARSFAAYLGSPLIIEGAAPCGCGCGERQPFFIYVSGDGKSFEMAARPCCCAESDLH